MTSVKELWERVQEMFRTPSEFEMWIASRHPQNAADLENLIKQWNYRQFRQTY
jgi:hypothetical protein